MDVSDFRYLQIIYTILADHEFERISFSNFQFRQLIINGFRNLNISIHIYEESNRLYTIERTILIFFPENMLLNRSRSLIFFSQHLLRKITGRKKKTDIFYLNEMIMNNTHKQNISKGTTDGKLKSAQRGYFIGSVPPFGYRKWIPGDACKWNPRVLIIDEKTACAVQDSFESFANGDVSYRDIAQNLNEQGYLSAGNKPFNRETVRQMLSNPIYIGKIAYRRKGSAAQQLFSGKHQPIISIDLWEEVQAVRSKRRSKMD